MTGPDPGSGAERPSDVVRQTGAASGGSNALQAGRDITVHGHVVAVRHVPVTPPMEAVPVPPGAGRRPAVAGPFVGRDAESRRLAAAVERAAGRTSVVVVHGPRGVGKSALVARFAESHADRFTPVWWITADSPAALDAGLADLAAALAPHVADQAPGQRVESGLRWLASWDGWLLVLDDLTDLGDAARVTERVRTGTVVITSRRAVGWRGVATVAVDVLPPDDAVELLSRSARETWPEADLTGAEALCAQVGWLPAAIEQAGAHLARHRVTPLACLDGSADFPTAAFTAPGREDDVPRLVRDFAASPDHEVRLRIVGELAGSGSAAAVAALRSLRPLDGIDRIVIREALGGSGEELP